jgi:histidine ammonia-lyase
MLMLDGQRLTLQELADVAYSRESVALSDEAVRRMTESRAVIEEIVRRGQIVYGVSTGFGKLSDVHVPDSQLRQLQLNLVRSHACGIGAPLSIPEARAMTLLRANVLALGYSGARPEVAQILIHMLERGVTPVVPEKGSVGASGDLAPLAHLALCVVGEGEVFFEGSRMPTAEAFQRTGIAPITLEAKEGLALLNGTQAMGAVGGLALYQALRLLEVADEAGAMTLEALLGTPVAFDERIHSARPHSGQSAVARHLRELLEGSEIRESHMEGDPRVQDAYSLRCMPQVHGAVRGAIAHAVEIVGTETGSGTDNPLVFTDTSEVLSGGNFHGAPLALAFDYAALALTDLASISERRIDRLINPDMNEGLPAFLTNHPGTGSGFMIAHVSAVALLNECRVLSHPASIDNSPTSGGKEDHVSMGMVAALKLRQIVWNLQRVLAIELLTAAEGLEYRKPLRPGKGVQAAYERVRKVAPPLGEDRALSSDIERIASSLLMQP